MDDSVLYAVLHEAIYCQGAASNWAAERVGRSLRQFQYVILYNLFEKMEISNPEFPLILSWNKLIKGNRWLTGEPQAPMKVSDHPLYFSGEMIYPFMFENSPELEKLAAVSNILAKYTEWPQLYDEWQLARNEVPLYAATFVDDMYVDFGLAQETARLVKNCKQFITNTMYHNAIRSKTSDVLKELFALRDDSID